jgi:RNA 3'-terminal phosphate cyclase
VHSLPVTEEYTCPPGFYPYGIGEINITCQPSLDRKDALPGKLRRVHELRNIGKLKPDTWGWQRIQKTQADRRLTHPPQIRRTRAK